VRLASDQAAFEHVVIECLATGPVVRCLATTPPTTLGGAPFMTLPLAATSVLRIGATQVEIAFVVAAVKAKDGAVGPAMIAKLAVVGALLVAIGMVSRMNKEEPLAAAPKGPELFAKAPSACPRTDLGEARAIAEDLRASAEGARERSPFDPREARSAVKSYETAAACYRLTQNAEAAEEAALSAKRMREETVADFRARRVRLERLLIVKDYEVASQDVTVLRALTEGQQGEYSQWLTVVAQEIKNQQMENGQ
jgi:hypothetical protein